MATHTAKQVSEFIIFTLNTRKNIKRYENFTRRAVSRRQAKQQARYLAAYGEGFVSVGVLAPYAQGHHFSYAYKFKDKSTRPEYDGQNEGDIDQA